MKYIIYWDAGYGEEREVVEATDVFEANKIAYETWKEAVESHADYGVEGESTEELKELYDL